MSEFEYLHDKKPVVVLMRGISGSGKSTRARRMAAELGSDTVIVSADAAVEIWKPIILSPGYEISSEGRIRSFWSLGGNACIQKTPQRVLKLRRDKDGYLLFTPGHRGDTFKVHQLVLKTFLGPPPTGTECVRHLNGNNSDNRLTNLVWGTLLENSKDTIKHGHGNEGSKNGFSSLTEENVLDIRRLSEKGYSSKYLAKHFGVSVSNINLIKARRHWRHVL